MINEKDSKAMIWEMTQYAKIFRHILRSDMRVPGELLGLVSGIRVINMERRHPDNVITRFNISWDFMRYDEFIGYLDEHYNKKEDMKNVKEQ